MQNVHLKEITKILFSNLEKFFSVCIRYCREMLRAWLSCSASRHVCVRAE